METNTLVKGPPSCPLVSPLSKQPCRGPRTCRWVTTCAWCGPGRIRTTGPWLSVSSACFQGIFLLWTPARRGLQLKARSCARFDPAVPGLASFQQEHENLCSVKQVVMTFLLALMAGFRTTKGRELKFTEFLLCVQEVQWEKEVTRLLGNNI